MAVPLRPTAWVDKGTYDARKTPLVVENNLLSCLVLVILVIARFSCLEARCVCRQAAVEAAKILPVEFPRSKQDPINRGHITQYLYRPPRQPGLGVYSSQIALS
jgi:hypothetical protein